MSRIASERRTQQTWKGLQHSSPDLGDTCKAGARRETKGCVSQLWAAVRLCLAILYIGSGLLCPPLACKPLHLSQLLYPPLPCNPLHLSPALGCCVHLRQEAKQKQTEGRQAGHSDQQEGRQDRRHRDTMTNKKRDKKVDTVTTRRETRNGDRRERRRTQ